jgi:hypothetical protein
LFDPTHILRVKEAAYLESLTATFINRNTAGAYFGSCAVIWLLLLLEQMRRQMPPGLLVWREMAERVLSAPPRVVAVAFVMFCLCLLAMFMTGSRAASTLSLAALVLAFTTYFRRHLPARTGLLTALAGAQRFGVRSA